MFGVQRCCCVSFRHHGGEYSNTPMGESLFDVAAKALDFFCAPNWKGPRPRRDTLLEVTILGDQRRYRVVAGRIERLGYPLHLKGGYLLPVERRNTILLGMTMTGLVSAIFAVMLVLSMVLLFRSRPTR